jgi:hypothetical protein
MPGFFVTESSDRHRRRHKGCLSGGFDPPPVGHFDISLILAGWRLALPKY